MLSVISVLCLGGCSTKAVTVPEGSNYLFVWSGDSDAQDSDFLTVIDARAAEPTYGDVIASLPVGAMDTMPHHTQYEFPDNDLLFLNGWKAGRTFVVDVADPSAPKLVADFEALAGYSYPHSFATLPSGNVLGTFQTTGGTQVSPGGLVEISPSGEAIQAVSSRTPAIDDELNWPYSVTALPELGLAITTSSDMGFPPMNQWEYHFTNHVQLWQLEPLGLSASVALPEGSSETHQFSPAEVRRVDEGSVYVNTFGCGLYRLDELDSDSPSATFVHSFPGSFEPGEVCFVPAVIGNYWVQTVPALPGLIVVDLGDPRTPSEVARLELDAESYPEPHWLAADRQSNRLVVTGRDKSWVLIVQIDGASGALSIDARFRDAGSDRAGIRFDREEWPHGRTGNAWVHGALFGK